MTPRRRRGMLAHRARVIGAHAIVTLRDQGAYLGELALGGAILFVFLFVLSCLWTATFRAQESSLLGGLTLVQMTWYVTFTEALVMSRVNVARRIDEDIRTGNLAHALLRPGGYLTARFGAYLAERLVRFAFSLGFGSVVALALAGPVVIDPVAALGAIVATGLAFVLEFAIIAGIGLGAFWTEDTSSIYFLYTRVSLLLGGVLIPIELFPEGAAIVARALPFAPMIHGPARLALAPDGTGFLSVIASLVVSLTVVGTMMAVGYRSGLERLTVQGG